jgi:hypothetical protein
MTYSSTTATKVAPNRPYTGTVADWPLFFNHLQFGVACFDTQGCEVTYHQFEFGTPATTKPLAEWAPQAYDRLMTASYGPVPRTSPPAQVRWRCKDGTPLEAEVDIAAIFADGAIRHEVPREDIPEEVSMGSTHVLVEVEDRTINVYTRTMIPTKREQIPGNRFSAFRNDLIKVYSKTH